MTKCFLILSATVLLSLGVQANPKEQFLQRVIALDGRTGVVASNFEERTSGRCTIEVELDAADGGLSLFFRDTGTYFTPVAHVFPDAELISENTLLVSTNPDRAGGDKCGDFGGAIRYKKTISLKNNAIQIEETFRCTFEGFKKYQLVSSCSF